MGASGGWVFAVGVTRGVFSVLDYPPNLRALPGSDTRFYACYFFFSQPPINIHHKNPTR